jgi:hypothetical protein
VVKQILIAHTQHVEQVIHRLPGVVGFGVALPSNLKNQVSSLFVRFDAYKFVDFVLVIFSADHYRRGFDYREDFPLKGS